MRLVVDAVLPLSVAAFHAAFVADDAGVLRMTDFHERRGDHSITVSEWVEAGGDEEDDGSGRGGPRRRGSTEGGDGAAVEPLVTRTMRLRMPLEPQMFAPKETAVEKLQRCCQYEAPGGGGGGAPMLLVDTAARSMDIPFGACVRL